MINELTELIQSKTGIKNKHFIRLMILNQFSQVATNMRVSIKYYDGTVIPVNMYGLAMAVSGFGKGRLTNILEDELFYKFKNKFMNELAPSISVESLQNLAEDICVKNGIDQEEAMDMVMKRWNTLPKFLYNFSEATDAGLKGARERMTMAGVGGTNMMIDEIGINLEKMEDVVGTMLEVYDMAKAKSKLIKVDSNSDSGRVPASLFMFGTPSRLMDGSKTEARFFSMLQTGYARRTLFAYVREYESTNEVDADEILNIAKNGIVSNGTDEFADRLELLASMDWHNKEITIPDDVAKEIIKFEKIDCVNEVSKLKDHQELLRLEITHEYWKLTKMLGLIALANQTDTVTMEDFELAKEIVLDSRQVFINIMDREPNYKRLFKYIVDAEEKLTQADLVEHLHFYSSANQATKREMMLLAMAHGYKNGAVIKETAKDGVVFYEGTQYDDIDESKIILSVSNDLAYDYKALYGKWEDLGNVLKTNIEYSAHHFIDGHRCLANAKPEFNIVILDIDDGTPLSLAMALMKEYKYLIGTTKSHRKSKNGKIEDRFRLILPLAKTISLNNEEYSQFMQNVYESLPFEVDTATKDASRKFTGVENAEIFYNEGQYLDPIEFIPNTTRANERRNRINDMTSLDNIERFFMLNASKGERNNHLIRFALMLTDGGLCYEDIEEKVLSMNDKLDNPLPVREIMSTVMNTVKKRINEDE